MPSTNASAPFLCIALSVAAAALLGTPATAIASPPGETPAISDIQRRVDTFLERGIEFYAEKQYELAIVEFRAGYGLDPRPELLFALAQAERLSGDCSTAVIYYQRFLETTPDSNQAEAARVNMRRCARALESGVGGRPAAPADQQLAVAEGASAPAPRLAPGPLARPTLVAQSPQRDGSWLRDPVGGGLAASSAVGLGLGLGFWIAKAGAESAAANASDLVAHQDALDRARRDRTLSLVSTGAGIILGVAATYRYLSIRGETRPTAVTVIPTRGGGAVSFTGRF